MAAEALGGSRSLAGFLMAAGLDARAKAMGRLRYLRHLGTYARLVKLLYPLRSIASRICLQHDSQPSAIASQLQNGPFVGISSTSCTCSLLAAVRAPQISIPATVMYISSHEHQFLVLH